MLWTFVSIIDTSEVFDIAASSFRVHTFCIALLADFERRINENLHKAIAADHASHLVARGAVGTDGRAKLD